MKHYLAFSGHRLVADGDLLTVALETKNRLANDDAPMTLVFDAASGRQIDLDLSGSRADLKARFQTAGKQADTDAAPAAPAKRGRPKLGVTGREVTLLPTHWRWLDSQRGGASATLRRLVNQARRENEAADRVRDAQDSAYRLLHALAGDLPGFEAATRALYAKDRERYAAEVADWPSDVRETALAMAENAFPAHGEQPIR